MDKQHRLGFTVASFMVALVVGAFETPTDVVKVAARGMGFEHLQPWRSTSQDGLIGRVRHASAALHSAWQRLWGHPLRNPVLAGAALAVASLALGADGHVGLLAIATVGTLDRRAQLLSEAEALRAADGTFATDQARAEFDAKMAEIETIDSANPTHIVERNPLDPGAPIVPGQPRMTIARTEPTDADRGADLERDRITGITLACRAARIPSEVMDKLIKDKTPLVTAQAQIFEELRKRGYDTAGPANAAVPDVALGQDPLIHQRAGIENAMLHRFAPDKFKLDDRGRQYRGLRLLDTARVFLQARGVRVTNLSPNELAGAALGLSSRGGMHTTSDFSNLLADVANKTLRAAYAEQPQTFAPLGRRVTIPDFKPVNRMQFGDAPALLEISEHGEYTSGTISDGKETYQLATYGRKFAITRKAIINDDTDAFARVPMMFGRKARILESNLAWAQITGNPIMGDGNALFSIAHANLAATDGPIAVDTLGAARAALRKQTSLDGDLMNLSARYLLVGPSQETLADQYVTVITPAVGSNVNPFAGKLTVIAEPRLEASEPDAWWVAASPDQVDMLEFGYLEGEEGPMVESRVGFDIDGLEIKARLDFATKVLDWRGFFKNEGDS